MPRRSPTATPDGSINVPASWVDPADSEREIALGAGHVRRTVGAHERRCLRELHGGRRGASDEVAYGGTLQRLQQVKASYDPQNVFRLNQNIHARR